MKILGLDLGPTSIGWALINTDSDHNPVSILGMGSRVIPYSDTNIAAEFSKGKGNSPCMERTRCRQMRRNLDRFQLHRDQLKKMLCDIGLINDSFKIPPANPLEKWKTRADAAVSGTKLSPDELAGVLFHINHRRGYKHAKSDLGDSKQTDYVEKINNRYSEILKSGKTVGQYFYEKLKESEVADANGKRHYTYRIKEQVCPRKAYEDEVDRILKTQSEHYPRILTEENRRAIKQVIFYQRPLKSCKNLVSFCRFERHEFLNKSGKKVESGPKVSPRTSPLSQVCRIYETINNIRLVNIDRRYQKSDPTPSLFDDIGLAPKDYRKLMPEYKFSEEERKRIFDFLNTHEKMSEKNLLEILGLTSDDGFKPDKTLGKGIQGNTTRCQIADALRDCPLKESLLKFDLTEEIPASESDVDTASEKLHPQVSATYIRQPLYQLWHTLYSIKDKEELFGVLSNKFGIVDQTTLNRLYAINFVKDGYANKSAKFMRKLIPLLRNGMEYSEACAALGKKHSNSLTKEENDNRPLQWHLRPIYKGELRQPVVEKILNQMINIVNAIKDEYGEIDEVRVELARELKRDKKGREKMFRNISKRERENNELSAEIADLNILPTRRRIQKMRMLRETGSICIYCGKTVTPYRFIEGHGYEIEHIIPRSRLFDDSLTNKVCACRECNAAKGAQTAFDFMKSKGSHEFNSYLRRIEDLYKDNKISRDKRDRLLMSASEIPEDFIERDLRLTQYITTKSLEILSGAIRNVYASSGIVTDFFRHAWGYDTILHDLNLPRYEAGDLTEKVEYETHGQKHSAMRIRNWSKRKDHRHHALDALVIALTRQGYIQRLNSLNADSGNSDKSSKWRSLDKWASERPHFERRNVIQTMEEISISFKPGKKLATPGKRYIRRNGKRICVQTGVSVPRAPLHKDTVYGSIRTDDGEKSLKFALENPGLVTDSLIRQQLELLLGQKDGDISKTLKFLKKNPLEVNGKPVEKIRCWREEIVVKYPVESIRFKDLCYVVDSHIRTIIEKRFHEVNNADKEFVKSLAERPLYSDNDCNHRIRTVRLFSGLQKSTLAGVRRDENGRIIGYTQKRNNDHVAFYRTPDSKVVESVVSFWDCIKRKKIKLSPIIKNPADAWDQIIALEESDVAEEIAEMLPPADSTFIMSLQRNEMVVLGMSDDQWNDAVATKDIRAINRHLYRVWKLSSKNYCFKYHTNTTAATEDGDKEIRQHYIITSPDSLFNLNPRKVVVSLLGKINSLSDDKENPML